MEGLELEKENQKHYQHGFRAGIEHSQSAPETRERFIKLEGDQKLIMEKINTLEEKILELQATMVAQHAELMKTIEKLAQEKANVWVENAFRYIIYAIGSILITAVMALIVIEK